MAEMALFLELGTEKETKAVLAAKFVDGVKALIAEVGIEPKVKKLTPRDFNEIIQAAFKEANSTYAVPKYMSYDDAEKVLLALAG